MNMKQRKTVPIHRNNYNHPTTNSLSVLFCFVFLVFFFFQLGEREKKNSLSMRLVNFFENRIG